MERHFQVMKHNAILCNSGHFDCEVDVAALGRLAEERFPGGRTSRASASPDGRILNVLAEGRLVNLAAGNGHPAEIMDMSFAVQALSLEWMAKHARLWRKGLQRPGGDRRPDWLRQAGRHGLAIDALTPEQEAYLTG